MVKVWPHIEHFVRDANGYGLDRFTVHDWLAMAVTGHADLWVNHELTAASVGRVNIYPQARVYTIVLFGGKGGHAWPEYARCYLERSKELQCAGVEVIGRPGWRNIMKHTGFKQTHCVWTLEASNES